MDILIKISIWHYLAKNNTITFTIKLDIELKTGISTVSTHNTKVKVDTDNNRLIKKTTNMSNELIIFTFF